MKRACIFKGLKLLKFNALSQRAVFIQKTIPPISVQKTACDHPISGMLHYEQTIEVFFCRCRVMKRSKRVRHIGPSIVCRPLVGRKYLFIDVVYRWSAIDKLQ